MTMHRNALLAALALLAPLTTAHAAINTDDPGDGGGGGGTGGGGTTGPVWWQKSFSKSALFGSTTWGAGYKVSGAVSATPATADYKDRLAANGGLETYAKLDGSYLRLFAVRAVGSTEAKKRTDLSFNAYAGPATIYSKSYASTTSTYTLTNLPQMTWPQTFINKSVNITLGIIPVTFTVKATGELKAGLGGKLSNVGIEANAQASGKASLYASAAIGGKYCIGPACVGASAGVYSDVKLVEANAPANLSIWWSLAQPSGVLLNYIAKSTLTLSSLDGELGVFADACLGGCIHESVKLISWTGFHTTYTIANMTGTYCLAGTCTIATSPGMKL